MSDLINATIGLFVGLASGYIFERRATVAARAEAARLQTELRALRESVYTVGGGTRSRSLSPGPNPVALEAEFLSWLVQRQDAEGRVLLSRATSEFLSRGHRDEEINDVIEELTRSGRVSRDQGWVRPT